MGSEQVEFPACCLGRLRERRTGQLAADTNTALVGLLEIERARKFKEHEDHDSCPLLGKVNMAVTKCRFLQQATDWLVGVCKGEPT